MRAALEACGEFLCRLGALQEATAILEMLRNTGVELSEASAFRWRALLAAVRQEVDAEPMDAVFVYEGVLKLHATKPTVASKNLFESPLFFHILVERFAVAFEGLDAELFKLESDELWQAEGIVESCELIRDQIEADNNESKLGKFLQAFKRIFGQDEPKDCWDTFYELYHVDAVDFRSDMKRALSVIASVTLGPTKQELAFPDAPSRTEKVIPRPLLEKRTTGPRQEWRDLNLVPGTEGEHDTNEEENQEGGEQPEGNVNGAATESVQSEISEDEPVVERQLTSRPLRASEVARSSRQENRRSVQRAPLPRDEASTNNRDAFSALRAGRTKRKRWSKEEEAALIKGYQAYSRFSNVWVLTKSKYEHVLYERTNVDLKDKYRNLVKYGRIPRSSRADDGNPNGANTGSATDDDISDDNFGEDGRGAAGSIVLV